MQMFYVILVGIFYRGDFSKVFILCCFPQIPACGGCDCDAEALRDYAAAVVRSCN